MFGNSRNASAAAMPVDIMLNTSSVSSRVGEAWNSMVRDGVGLGHGAAVGTGATRHRRACGTRYPNCYSAATKQAAAKERRHKGGRPPCSHDADSSAPRLAPARRWPPARRPARRKAQKRTIVDAQIHMWKANTPDWPWVEGAKPQLPEPFTIERAIAGMDEAGVDRAVIVPPTPERPQRLCARSAQTLSEPLRRHGPHSACKIRNRPSCCRNGKSSRACSACG